MMVSDNKFDPKEWLQRLESGDNSEPRLELAAKIMDLTPELPGPSPAFQNKLRSQLVEQCSQKSNRRRIIPRWLAWGFAALVVISLVLVGLRNLPGNTPSASAAEILNLASQRISSPAMQDGVLYDRLLLDWKKGGFRENEVVAELWRSTDGSQLRYQMYAGERLLYFDQHENEHLWRSSHIRPVEGEQVDFVYQASYELEEGLLTDEQIISQLLFGDFGNFWVHIDQLAGGKHAECANPFCVLTALGGDWVCKASICSLNLGPVPIAGDMIIEAKVLQDDWLSNGHEVHQVQLQLAGEDDRYYQVLKFDTTTYDLIEIEKYSKGKLQYRLRLDDRQALSSSELPDDFFKAIPGGVEVRPWNSDYPLGHQSLDRVWVISSDPPPGAVLREPFNAHIELGYRLTSIEKAAINMGGLNWGGHDTRVKLDVDEVMVEAGEGVIEVDFMVDTTELGDGRWAIWPTFRDVLGINLGPGYGWNSFGDPAGIYPEWCIRCEDSSADS